MTYFENKLGSPLDTIDNGERGMARYWVVERRIFFCQVHGRATVEQSQRSNEICTDLVRQGHRIYLVNDWYAVNHFEARCRGILVSWATKNSSNIVAGHYLAQQTLLRMALHVANLPFRGRLNLYESQLALQNAFSELKDYVRMKDRAG